MSVIGHRDEPRMWWRQHGAQVAHAEVHMKTKRPWTKDAAGWKSRAPHRMHVHRHCSPRPSPRRKRRKRSEAGGERQTPDLDVDSLRIITSTGISIHLQVQFNFKKI